MDILKNLTAQQKVKIASYLLGLANKRIDPIEHHGICDNLRRFFRSRDSITKLVMDVSIGWPKHSQTDFYPAPTFMEPKLHTRFIGCGVMINMEETDTSYAPSSPAR